MIGKSLSTSAIAGLALALASCSRPSPAPEQLPGHATHALSPSTAAAARATDRGKLLGEAVSALRETQNALAAIDHNKPDDAIAALERATGKLEIVLARTPDLALAPVNMSATTIDLLANPQEVERAEAAARTALDGGRVQEARQIISTLASETVVSTSNLPLATYPAALKQAAALLHQGKPQEAKAVLEGALNTIVVERTIIPLPLLRAQAATEAARTLSAKAARTTADDGKVKTLLATARSELQLGQALGYATPQDMNGLLAAIDQIDHKVDAARHGPVLFDRLRGMFDHARKASQAPQGRH